MRIEQSDVDEALKQLRAAANMAVTPEGADKRRWVPGLSIVVVGGAPGNHKVLFSGGFGTTSTKDPAPVDENTLFPCASVSKPVSTSLIARAFSHPGPDVVTPTEPLWKNTATRDPGNLVFALVNAPEPKTTPTIRQWLSHRSGLPDHAGDLIEDMSPGMSRSTLLDCIMLHQTGITPGEYAYTNFGFTMGCLGAIRVMTGRSNWSEFANEQFKALGMTRSTYQFTLSPDKATSARVRPHQGKPDVPDLLKLTTTGWKWDVVEHDWERDPTRQAPAGGLLSCASDLGVFLLAHLDKKFGKDFPAEKPNDDELVGDSRWYSLGWNVARHFNEEAYRGTNAINGVSFSHSGAFSLGAGTCIRLDPDAGYGIAILSNGEPTGVPEALSQIFFKYLYATPMPPGCHHADVFALCRQLYLGDLYKKKIENYGNFHADLGPIPADMPQGEIFRVHSDYYACDIAINYTPPDLILTMGNPAPGRPAWSFKLSRIGHTSSYAYTTIGENEVGISPIAFTWEGNVLTEVEDTWLQSSGTVLGKFRRK